MLSSNFSSARWPYTRLTISSCFDRALKGLAFISRYIYCIPNICPSPKTRLGQSTEINGNRIELYSCTSKRTTLVTFIAVRIPNVRIVPHTDCDFKDRPISHKLRKYVNFLHAKHFLSLTYLNPITTVTVKLSLAMPGRRRAGQKHSSNHA
jgi:hypothetical protein